MDEQDRLGIECTREEDGFCGRFFLGTRFPYAVIIRVAGTGARREQVLSSSRFLLEAGFSVLCLGYQNWGTLGAASSEIPIDFVSQAVAWLRRRPEIDPDRIGMTGISLGALYTLLAATYIPELAAIALASPFDAVMEGLDPSLKPTGHSTFVWQGEEVPFHPWTILKRRPFRVLVQALCSPDYGLGRLLRFVYDHNSFSGEPRIPVERIRAKVLVLASQEDDCWPSEEALVRIVDRLHARREKESVEFYLYAKGCHNMGGNMDMSGWTGLKLRALMRSWKTHPEECRACIADSQKRIVAFFEQTLLGMPSQAGD